MRKWWQGSPLSGQISDPLLPRIGTFLFPRKLDQAWILPETQILPQPEIQFALWQIFSQSQKLLFLLVQVKTFRNANHFKLRKEKNSFCINSFLHKIGLEWAGYLWLIFKKLKWSWIGENKQWKIYVFESIVFVKASPFLSFQRCDLWFMESPTYLNVFTVQVFVLHLCRYSAKIDPFQSNWIKRQMQLQKWCWPQPRFENKFQSLKFFWDS